MIFQPPNYVFSREPLGSETLQRILSTSKCDVPLQSFEDGTSPEKAASDRYFGKFQQLFVDFLDPILLDPSASSRQSPEGMCYLPFVSSTFLVAFSQSFLLFCCNLITPLLPAPAPAVVSFPDLSL